RARHRVRAGYALRPAQTCDARDVFVETPLYGRTPYCDAAFVAGLLLGIARLYDVFRLVLRGPGASGFGIDTGGAHLFTRLYRGDGGNSGVGALAGCVRTK